MPSLPKDYVERWPGIYVLRPVEAAGPRPEDEPLIQNYAKTPNRGTLVSGCRISLLTQKSMYRAGEPVRILHVLEIVVPGQELYIMGPKLVYGEEVDGVPDKMLDPTAPDVYDGVVVPSPDVDFNYEVTSYIFDKPGKHTIQWILGSLRSNTIELEIV